MLQYIYLPIPTDEFTTIVRNWQDGQREKKKDPCKILGNSRVEGLLKGVQRRLTGGCLKVVQPGDRPYILAHGTGNENEPFVLVRRKGVEKKYTAEQLAQVLQREGLSKSITDVRLFTCESGVGSPTLAEQLKDELARRGYQNVVVSGYLGDTHPTYAPRNNENITIGETSHKGVMSDVGYVRAKTKRVRFS